MEKIAPLLKSAIPFSGNFKHLVFIVAFCVLAYGIHLAARMGTADSFAYLAKKEILSWSAANSRVNNSSWFLAKQHYLAAAHLMPDHPDYLYNLGRLQYLNVLFFIPPLANAEALAALEEAETYLKQSIRERPAWPLAWAHLAMVKAAQMKFDDQYLLAIERSTTLGPWEPGVQVAVTDSGFKGWHLLNKEYQRLVIDNALRGVNSKSPGQSGRMVRLIKNLQRESSICPFLPRQGAYQKLCSMKK